MTVAVTTQPVNGGALTFIRRHPLPAAVAVVVVPCLCAYAAALFTDWWSEREFERVVRLEKYDAARNVLRQFSPIYPRDRWNASRLKWARVAGDSSEFEAAVRDALVTAEGRALVDANFVLLSCQTGHLTAVEDDVVSLLMGQNRPEGVSIVDVSQAYANALSMSHRFEDAEAVLTAWAADEPDDPRPHLSLARLYWHTHRETESRRALEAALEIAPDYGAASYLRGRIAFAENDIQTAIESFGAAAEDLDSHYAALVGLGKSLLAAGDAAGEETLLRAASLSKEERLDGLYAVQDHAESTSAFFELGVVAAASGDHTEAVDWFEKDLADGVDSASVRLALAQSLRALRRHDEALGHVQSATESRELLTRADAIVVGIASTEAVIDQRLAAARLYLEAGESRTAAHWARSVFRFDSENSDAAQLVSQAERATYDTVMSRPHVSR